MSNETYEENPKKLSWKNVFEKVSFNVQDEKLKREIFNVDILKLNQMLEALKKYRSVFSTTGQYVAKKECKKSMKRLKELLKLCSMGFTKYIKKKNLNYTKNLNRYDMVIPNSILEKVNKGYFLFESFHVEPGKEFNTLFGKLKTGIFGKDLYCYIDTFENVSILESDISINQKLYRDLKVKAFIKNQLTFILVSCFMITLAILLVFLFFSDTIWSVISCAILIGLVIIGGIETIR